MNNKKQVFAILASALVAVFSVSIIAQAVTTIGNNVSVGGTLAVTATSTLASKLYMNYDASNFVSFIVNSTGDINVSPNENTGGVRIYGNATSPNIVGGYSGNVVGNGYGNIIGGGGESGYINSIANSINEASILGGYDNNIDSGSYVGVIVGGAENTITGVADEQANFIGGGFTNTITAAGVDANNIGRNIIVGGEGNTITITNAVENDGHSFIGGGMTNNVTASFGTIPGGTLNTVSGAYGFAAGRRAKATASGAFALTDSTNADFTVGTANVFGARFSGGYWLTGGSVGIGTTTPAVKLHIINGTATTTIAIGSGIITTKRGKLCQWNGADYTITEFAASSVTPIYSTSTTCE